MFRTLFPFHRLLATSFLLVFVNVLVGKCWCATNNLPQPAASMAAMCHHKAPPAHLGCHEHVSTVAQHPKQPGHLPKSTRCPDCSKNKAASLLSSLTAAIQKNVVTPVPAILPVVMELFFRPQAGKWDRTGVVALVPPRHLKPKIPDIRIFIQSLIV
jgi:hypothetical protein